MRSVTIRPSDVQNQIILGTILGDGSLEFNGYQGTRLQIKQSVGHKDYVFWLYEMLKDLCRSEPKEKPDTKQWYFSTRGLKEFTSLWNLFYRNNRKVIPQGIERLLVSPLSLAVWFMDDGSLDFRPKDHCSFMLHTDSFSKEDVLTLAEVLKRNFGIDTKVYSLLSRETRYPKIYIGSKGRERFLELVEPYILSCFRYKLPPVDPSETEPSLRKVRWKSNVVTSIIR